MLHLLDPLIIEDIQNPEHPSDFIVKDSFVILILRLPEVKGSVVHITSYSFIVQDERVYLYNRELNEIKELGSLTEMNQFLDNKIDN